MGRNLTSLPISASFQYLLQKSGSEVNDGLGADVDFLNISASYAYTASVADTATSASHAVNADSSISASFATTASYAENVTPINTGSFYISSSVTDAEITFTQGDGSTESVVVNNVSSSISASFATSGNGTFSGSFSGSFEGDGSGLTGITATGEWISATGVSSSVAEWMPSSSVSSNFSVAFSSASVITATEPWNVIMGGFGQTISGGQGYGASIIGGWNNTISTNYGGGIMASNGCEVQGYHGVIIGAINSSNTNNNVNRSGIYSGKNHSLASADDSVILGGDNNTLGGSRSAVIAGKNHTMGVYDSVIVGGTTNQTSQGVSAIVGGNSHLITKSNSFYGGIFAGNNHEIVGNFGDNEVIIGGNTNSIRGSNGTYRNQNNAIVGGQSNQITDNSTGASGSFNSIILGGWNNDIRTDLYAGYMTGSAILAGMDAVNKHNRSVIIGGSGLTTTQDDEVVVPNLTISGSGAVLTFADGTTQATAGGGGSAFPYTGSADISGSIDVVGWAKFGASTTSTYANDSNFVAGSNNQITSTGASNTILGGSTMTITNGSSNTIIGGDGQRISSTGARNAIFNGWGGATNGITGGTNNTIVGGVNNNIASTSQSNIIAGGRGNDINAGERAGIFAGLDNEVNHNRSVVIGGNALSTSKDDEVVVPQLTIDSPDNLNDVFSFKYSDTAGGGILISDWQADTTGGGYASNFRFLNTSTYGAEMEMIATRGDAYLNAPQSKLIVEANNDLELKSISGNITIPADDLIMTGSFRLDGNISFDGYLQQDVKPVVVSANTASLNGATSNMFTIALTSSVDTHVEVSNILAGQTFQCQVSQPAGTPGTISFSPDFKFEGGTAFTATATGSAIDVITFTSFNGTDVLCVGSKNFS